MSNLYKDYDKKTLRKLQKLERMILKDFDRLCRQYNIDYFGDGGTCIGAVRHGGFIPWDDDIDIGMSRRDYQRFVRIAPTFMPEKYNIVNPELTKGCPFIITRMVLKDTVFLEECFKNSDYPSGIFIDIACYDNASDSFIGLMLQGWSAWFWGKLYTLYYTDKPVLYFGGIRAGLLYAVFFVLHKFMHLCHVSPSFLYRRAIQASRRYENDNTRRIALFFDPTPFMGLVSKKIVFPTKNIDFDGMMIKFPKNTDAYLSKYYGDYMSIPPRSKRHNHPPYKLEFGKWK